MTPERLQFIEARVQKNESAPDLPDMCRELIAFAKHHVQALSAAAVAPSLVGELPSVAKVDLTADPSPPMDQPEETEPKHKADHEAKHKATHHGKK